MPQRETRTLNRRWSEPDERAWGGPPAEGGRSGSEDVGPRSLKCQQLRRRPLPWRPPDAAFSLHLTLDSVVDGSSHHFFDRKFNHEGRASYLTFRKLCCGGPGFFCGGDADDDARHPLPPLRKACADAGCAPSVPGGDAAGCRSDHGGGGRPGLDASAVPRTAAPACDLSDDPAAEPMD